jgi:hypothetical protein
VRWAIEEALRAAVGGLAFDDDGYGFARHSEAMLLSYATSEPERVVAALIDVLEKGVILGNVLAPAAMVAVAPRNDVAEAGQEFVHHRLVYPPDLAGQPVPD